MSFSTDDSVPSEDPIVPEDSPGSSVSTRLQDEYDELLKYAVVLPHYNPGSNPKTLADVRGSFTQYEVPVTQRIQDRHSEPDNEESTSTDVSSHGDSPEQEVNVRGPLRSGELSSHAEGTPRHPVPVQMTPVQLSKHNFQSDISMTPDSNTSTPTSTAGESPPAYSPSVDPDIVKMEQYLDLWAGDLKRNVLSELSRSKIKIMDEGRLQLQRQREKHASEVNSLQNDIESIKELLHTYEQSILRKDEVISNLTHGLQKQKEKLEMMRKFSDWKIRHNEQKREVFASTLAYKHHQRKISQKVWNAWHTIIEQKWRQRVERACQAKAQEVCMSLTNDYEARIASLNEALESSRTEVSKLHRDREHYEETMKKAFMRGVCALNMEAMTMFHEGDNQGGRTEQDENTPPEGHSVGSHGDYLYSDPVVIPQEPVYTSSRSHGPRIVTSQAAMSRSNITQSGSIQSTKSRTAASTTVSSSKQPKVVTVNVTGRSDTLRKSSSALGDGVPMGLAPPMSSVVVERHQPVVKQTIGHAVASKYPARQQSKSGMIHRRLAGQTIHNAPNIQSVKVVE